jgi:hypothetical protein
MCKKKCDSSSKSGGGNEQIIAALMQMVNQNTKELGELKGALGLAFNGVRPDQAQALQQKLAGIPGLEGLQGDIANFANQRGSGMTLNPNLTTGNGFSPVASINNPTTAGVGRMFS